jgi:hypothetical protein
MYAGARIASFLLRLVAWLLLAAAVLVWFVVTTPADFGFLVDPKDPGAIKAARDAAYQANLLRAAISAGCVVVALIILLFCDLVKAIVNTARDTHAMLEVLSRGQQPVGEVRPRTPPR